MPMTTSAPLTISRQQRRRQARLERKHEGRPGPRPVTASKPPSGPVWSHYKALTEPAYERLARNMVKYGNSLSDAHQRALMCIVARFTMLASGTYQGRYAYDLPCGGGKTQAVVAWCAELHHQDQPYSVAVCASRVEPLCEIKRELMANGVPDEAIGLIHSYKHDPELVANLDEGEQLPTGYATLPKTDGNEAKKILLVTHQKVRGAGGIQEYNVYNGKPRDLVIWDESLLVSAHRTIEKKKLDAGLSWLRVMARETRNAAFRDTMLYLEDAWSMIEAEYRDQRRRKRKPKVLTLPQVTAEQLDRMVNAIHDRSETVHVRAFLSISQSPLRVVVTNQGNGGLIKYEVVVPPELRNVAVLDASYAIRDLGKLDKSIQEDEAFDGAIKSYANVVINHLRAASGRGTMDEWFGITRREHRKVCQEVIDVIKTIPEDQAVLLFTFKAKGKVDAAHILKTDLRAAGVDVDATVTVDGKPKPRFAWLTWGRENSVSEFSYCRNVIFAGILHRGDVDLAGAVAGQSDDLTVDVTTNSLKDISRSEVVYGLHQAMNRGSCRDTINGQAVPMTVWLIHGEKEIQEPLSAVMPGLVWQEWEAKFIEAMTRKTEKAMEKIEQYLHDLPETVTKVSTITLKRTVGLSSTPKMTWVRAVAEVADKSVTWTKEDRSFVRRGTAAEHGF